MSLKLHLLQWLCEGFPIKIPWNVLLETKKIELKNVKGKKEGIKIFELMGAEINSEQKFVKENYEKGLSHYKKREWDLAMSCFEKISDVDYSAKMFIDRCSVYKKDDPGSDWDGVWRLSSK